MKIRNDAGEAVGTASSDFEAVRWFFDMGRKGDFLDDTGEPLADVAVQLGFVAKVRYTSDGCVCMPLPQDIVDEAVWN